MRRVDTALVAILGVLVSHQLAYMASSSLGYSTSVAHGHLKTAWLLGSLGLLAVLCRSVVASLRRRNHEAGNVAQLAGLIAAGYLVLEQFERALDGYGALALFGEPVFWFGLAAAPLVAVVLSWSLRSFEQAAARFIDSVTQARPVPSGASCSLCATSIQLHLTSPLSFAVGRRGPPAELELQ